MQWKGKKFIKSYVILTKLVNKQEMTILNYKYWNNNIEIYLQITSFIVIAKVIKV